MTSSLSGVPGNTHSTSLRNSPVARSREASNAGSGPVLHNDEGATDTMVSWCPPHHLMSVGVEQYLSTGHRLTND